MGRYSWLHSFNNAKIENKEKKIIFLSPKKSTRVLVTSGSWWFSSLSNSCTDSPSDYSSRLSSGCSLRSCCSCLRTLLAVRSWNSETELCVSSSIWFASLPFSLQEFIFSPLYAGSFLNCWSFFSCFKICRLARVEQNRFSKTLPRVHLHRACSSIPKSSSDSG